MCSRYEPAASSCILGMNLYPAPFLHEWTCCQFTHSLSEPAARTCIRVWTCCQFMHSLYEPAARTCIRVWTCCQFMHSFYEPAARTCIRVWTCCQFMHSVYEPAASSCICEWTCCQFMHSVYEPAASSCVPRMNLLPGHVFQVWTCGRPKNMKKSERIFIQYVYVHNNKRRTTRLPDTTHRT